MRWVIVCLMLVVAALPGPAAPRKVISLESFIDCAEWELNVTWNAKDTFEDRDHSGQVELAATARYVLKQLDRQDAWGHWQALQIASHNITYKGFWQSKTSSHRIDYWSTAGPVVAPVVDFQVGGTTPGYMIVCGAFYPGKVKENGQELDCGVGLSMTLKDQPGLTGETTGPLPEKGTTIAGSRVIPFELPPFLTSQAGMTKLSIQYVLKPYVDPLAPLVPPKKR